MTVERLYGIYRGDDFVDVGTAEELSHKLGISVKQIKYMTTPTYAKRAKNTENRLIAVKVEADRDDEQ